MRVEESPASEIWHEKAPYSCFFCCLPRSGSVDIHLNAVTDSSLCNLCKTKYCRLADGRTMTSIDTETRIPVDLTARLCLNAKLIAEFHSKLGIVNPLIRPSLI